MRAIQKEQEMNAEPLPDTEEEQYVTGSDSVYKLDKSFEDIEL